MQKSHVRTEFKTWEDACFAVTATLAEGVLIFLDIPQILFRKVAAGTNSWTSHVGIAFKNEKGAWVVAESSVPRSKETPLCDYLKRSSKYRFEVKRLNRSMTPAEIDLLRVTSRSMLKRFYGLGFNFDSHSLFCSKFVYLAFQAIGLEVGRVQTFRQLLSENPSASITFWKLWFLGSIPWERRTVTPASQLHDPKFDTVLGAT